MVAKAKIPKVDTVVEIRWLDSGLQLDRSGIPPENIELTPHWIWGKIIAKNKTCLVVAQECHIDGTHPDVDNYIAISYESIQSIEPQVPKRKKR